LRLADDKPCLTVLDFIGAQHADFRFDLRYRALTGATRRTLTTQVDHDFPTLPAGCHIQLDRIAKQIVLSNLRGALRLRRTDMIAELRRLGDVSLGHFLTETGLELEDVYRRRSGGGWTGLRRAAGLAVDQPGPHDAALGAAIGRMLHIDDPSRIDTLSSLHGGALLHIALWGKSLSIEDGARALPSYPDRCRELQELADVLRGRIRRVTLPSDDVPLRVHARYSRDEACVGFGIADPSSVREGVKWVPDFNADLFFVTLTKTERHYSPTTMYQDRAITPRLFQWESQSTTSTASPTGQRYVNHVQRGSTVHLFLRESKEPDGDMGAPPYLYAGRMEYQRHSGDRPMRIVWQLAHPLPADVFHASRVTAA
jgi:hypothetical protein